MLWRRKRSLHCIKQWNQIPNALPFFSIHQLSPPKARKYHEFSRENEDPNEGFRGRPKLELTPEIVHFTLSRCPSDLIALNFFFWCAKKKNYFHNAQAYDYMVGVVGKLTVRYKTIRGIIRELENVGCVVKPHIFLLLLRIYWRSRMYNLVFEVYEEMFNFGFAPNTLARNIVMDVLFKIELVDVAIKVLKETRAPNFLSFNIALCNLCKINDLSNLKDVITIMLRKGFYPSSKTFEMILNGFCKTGRLAVAHQVLGLMICLGISISANVWSMLINGCFGLRQPKKAVDLLNKMLETGCSPNVATYTSLIKGFVDSGMVSNAFRMLNTMESEGIVPDLVLSNVLIHIFTKMGRFSDALDIFSGLSVRKLVPDKYTFSSLVSNICSSRRFSLLPIIGNGIAMEADLVVCNSLLHYFCKAGYPSFAVKLYSDMIARGFIADNYSFASLLSALCREGKVSEAVDVYNGMILTCKGLDAHVHTAIINGLIKSGKYHKAIRLFRRCMLEKCPLDVVSYSVAIQGLVQAGRTGEAYSLYSQMKEVGMSPNAQTYQAIISGLCKEKDIEKIKGLLEKTRKEKIEWDSNMLIRLQKSLSRLSRDLLDFKQIFESRSLELVSDDGIPASLIDASHFGVKIGKNDLYMKNDMFSGSCSSDDLPDVAVSVG